jgi:DNA-binding FadR family transcriptional regulator
VSDGLNLASVDPGGGETVYLQVARAIRRQIIDGQLPLGERLPSARQVREQTGLGRQAYGRALAVLKAEGLVTMRSGLGAYVSTRPRLQVIILRPGDELDFREPDDGERERLGISPLADVAVVTRAGGGTEVYSQAVTRFRAEGESGMS